MSFQIICPHCGAPSSVSTGICPYCKSILSTEEAGVDHSFKEILSLYEAGRIDRALARFNHLNQHPESAYWKTAGGNLLAFKIYYEAQGSNAEKYKFLHQSLVLKPECLESQLYLDLLEAESHLSNLQNDQGEKKILQLIQKSPENPYPYFSLGVHLFWIEKKPVTAIRFLDRAVKLRPVFLRAWGCLGAIYEELKKPELANRAFEKCVELENDERMKAFFREKIR